MWLEPGVIFYSATFKATSKKQKHKCVAITIPNHYLVLRSRSFLEES